MKKEELELLKQLKGSSTEVVAWYAHPGQVRGPFNRWFEITQVADEYKKYVADTWDDAKYAAAAMNTVPKLIAEIERLKAENEVLRGTIQLYERGAGINQLREQIRKYRAALGFYAQYNHDAGMWDEHKGDDRGDIAEEALKEE